MFSKYKSGSNIDYYQLGKKVNFQQTPATQFPFKFFHFSFFNPFFDSFLSFFDLFFYNTTRTGVRILDGNKTNTLYINGGDLAT
jgi:hypothetical protein